MSTLSASEFEQTFFTLKQPKVLGKFDLNSSEKEFPAKCPDGSTVKEFTGGNYEEIPHFVQTCKYGESPELLVVHIWENGKKKTEMTVIGGDISGLMKIKSKLGFMVVEKCKEGQDRVEYFDDDGGLFAIIIGNENDKDLDKSLIDIIEPENTKFSSSYSKFKGCSWNDASFSSVDFNSKLYWRWTKLSPIKQASNKSFQQDK